MKRPKKPFLNYGVRVTSIDNIRNNGIGDWRYTPHQILAYTADTGDADSNLLIIIHELIEARLCQKHGVLPEVVDKFDEHNQNADEPGDLVGCPYRSQHRAAMAVEEYAALMLGVEWRAHEKRIAKAAG
jgi:hypothetical protein